MAALTFDGEPWGREGGRTAQFLQGLLGVGLAVAALADVTGLELHHGPHGRQGPAARLQVHLGKQLLAARPWFVVHPLVPAWDKQKRFVRGVAQSRGRRRGEERTHN